MGEKGSKWFANLLYSRPLALKKRYMGQPSRLCTASQPAQNQLYFSRELMSELSLVGTNTWGIWQHGAGYRRVQHAWSEFNGIVLCSKGAGSCM
jgi:hypothetical protein